MVPPALVPGRAGAAPVPVAEFAKKLNEPVADGRLARETERLRDEVKKSGGKAKKAAGEALERQSSLARAKDAFQKAIDSGSADAGPMAAIGLGELLADEGDVQGAKDAFQKAIDSGRPNAALAATAGLRMLTTRAHNPAAEPQVDALETRRMCCRRISVS